MSVDITQALNSANYAKKVWINYYYGDNTVGASASDIGKITSQWSSKISSWKDFAETMDETDYRVTDDDFTAGRNIAEEDSGYEHSDHQRDMQNAGTVGRGALAIGNTTSGLIFKGGLNKVSGKVLGSWVDKGADKAWNSAYSNGGKDRFTNAKNAEDRVKNGVGIIISCALDLATATATRLSKPNKDQKEAVDVYAEKMTNLQENCSETQNDLVQMDSELIDAADHAQEVSETANDTMSDSKAYYDYNASVIEYFESAKTAGYEFTEDDIAMYEESLAYMEEMNATVTTTQDEADTEINDTYSNMEAYQDGYDTAAETLGNNAGYTAEMASVDDSTQVQCYIEAGAETLNAGTAAVHAFKAGSLAATTGWCGLGVAYGVAAAAAAAAGIWDAAGAVEQFKWADKIGQDIKTRKETEDINSATIDSYNSYHDNYNSYKDEVKNVELIVPDEIDVPEVETPTLGVNGGNNPGSTDDGEHKKNKL